MDRDLQFDVAFSYAKDDAWIAKDIYNLVAMNGLAVYCYDRNTDVAAGFLRSRLSDIYRSSRLNVVLWSRAYATAAADSFPAMERRLIIHRHVEKGDDSTLFVLRADDHPLGEDIGTILAHELRIVGIFGAARMLSDRIRKVTSEATSDGFVQHPASTESARGPLYPCTFEIDPGYQTDPRDRWDTLADVLVVPSTPLRTPQVYLIPSGSCSPLLRHPDILRTDPDLLKRKRRATLAWAREKLGSKVHGFWFSMRKREAEIATVYSPEYDAALNRSLGSSSMT